MVKLEQIKTAVLIAPHLIAIEVPVIGKGDQDRNVSSGERSHELGDLLLSKTSNGVAGEITKKKWTTE